MARNEPPAPGRAAAPLDVEALAAYWEADAVRWAEGQNTPNDEADALEAARADIPALVAEVRRLRGENARLLEVADEAQRLTLFWRQGAIQREIGLQVNRLDAAIAIVEEHDGP